ncbi:MAG: hypothetical protein H0U19_06215 [Acidobacteria bacterium]|nr:hypothetical protein [Acidobacteriota bacterium]
MRRLFQRLFGRRGGRERLVCHLRENGPIAYELDLLASAPRDRADAMMSSGISWAWKSATREWTELTRMSLSAFLADLSSGGVMLAGTDGEPPTDLSDATVKEWIRRFCRLQPSTLVAVISAADGRQLLFVQQHGSDPVNRLLRAWDLDKGAAERKSYARLGSSALESLAERL